ncbi:MAG: hypothetical protein JXQ93_12790 [Flavobacteriaceae bacterium]
MKTKFTVLFFFFGFLLYAQEAEIKEHFKQIKSSDLMILGSFHFANPGLDSYKPKYEINIFSEQKQKELKEVLAVIKKFAPTKIAVEWSATRQKRLDSLYSAYLEGKFKLRSNEIYQIGFRLAKMLGHKKVYAVDAPVKKGLSRMTKEEVKKKEGYFLQKASRETLMREQLIHQTFMKLYAKGDSLKMKISLLDFFKVMNDPYAIQNSHGHYLIGKFKMGEGQTGDYYGADTAMWWYNRNLRIFQNILNINTPGKDKVFVLMGAGHLPILNFLAKSSVDFDYKSLQDVIDSK